MVMVSSLGGERKPSHSIENRRSHCIFLSSVTKDEFSFWGNELLALILLLKEIWLIEHVITSFECELMGGGFFPDSLFSFSKF